MKTLADGNEVPARGYYYLLDWNEVDEKITMNKHFNKNRLCDLNIKEYCLLWDFATKKDLENLKLIK